MKLMKNKDLQVFVFFILLHRIVQLNAFTLVIRILRVLFSVKVYLTIHILVPL